MAYDEYLAERVSRKFTELDIPFEGKHMMGGICFMVREKMSAGVVKNMLMVRIDPEKTEEALTRPGCKLMDFTGKTMKGFLFVEPEGVDREEDLEYYLQLALEFNPRANSSKKRSDDH